MLKIIVPKLTASRYDPEKEIFLDVDDPSNKEVVLWLEHSLFSLSKWESKWHKPFLRKDGFEGEEFIDYVRMMTVWPKQVPEEVYYRLTNENQKEIVAYIGDPMTATTFSKHKNSRDGNAKSPGRQQVTAELLYYSMIAYNIPFECEKWHLNRLMTLIHVCEIKNNPQKMSKKDQVSQTKALNAARRAKHHSRG